MRSSFLWMLILTFPLNAISQESDDNSTVIPATQNSISLMLLERPPALQPGFGSGSDRWLLYSPLFDSLTAGRQKFLLQKYGYLAGSGSGYFEQRKEPSYRRMDISPAPLPPGRNVKVTIADAEIGRRLQSEACIAVSGQNVVVGYNDSGGNERVSYSLDGGATWRQTQLPQFPRFGGNISDPVVAAGPDGVFYHSHMAPAVFGQIAIAVSRSDNGGISWSAPSNASASVMSSDNEHDKEWLAVDNVPGSPYRGNVYVSWSMFTFNPSGPDISSIRLARSTDGGRSWLEAVAVAELSEEDAEERHVIQGSYLAVGPGGELYVAWYDTRVSGVRLRRSADGGATFSEPVTALATPKLGMQFSVMSTGLFENPLLTALAVDTGAGPNRGTIYVAANDLSAAGNIEVVVARSADGGATWSAPVSVKNTTTNTDRFQPDIAVAENGHVGVIFYDRRNDPENNSLVDLYLAVSADGGRSFPVNTRVTTANWPVVPTAIGDRPGYHGDYNKIVAAGNNFYMAWGDDRSGLDPDVYMAVLPASGSLPDFVMASTRASADVIAGGSATFTIATPGARGMRFVANYLPGLSYQFSGNTLTVSTTRDTNPGTFSIFVRGANDAGLERATVVRLTVHSPDLARAPLPVTPVRVPAFASRAAADAAGNIHLLNVEETVSRYRKQISYRRIPAGKTEPEAAAVVFRADSELREQSVSDPRIAVDAGGRIYVAWRRTDRTNSVVLFSASEDGRTFSEPVNIAQASAPLTFAFRPSVAVARDGTVFVSFIKQILRESRPNVLAFVSQDLYLVRSSDGGANFSEPVNVSRYNGRASISSASAPALAVDSDSQPHFVWAALGDVYYTRSTDGGVTFADAVNASRTPNSSSAFQPALAVDHNKNVYVAWTNSDSHLNLQDILIAKSTDGASFETLGNLSFGTQWTGSFGDWPALASDGAGNITAVWRQMVANPLKNNDPQRDLFFVRSSDGGLHWSVALNFTTSIGDTLLGGSFATAAEPPAITVSPDGRVSIFYDDDTSGGAQIWMFQP